MYRYRYRYGRYEMLAKSISWSELVYLREVEKLTNKEIAKRYDIAYTTVLKYIGRQPKGLKKDRVS